MSNPNIQVFEYHGPCTPEYYNQFFNPNICHICKSVGRGNSILCEQCYLISYCSEEHKTLHFTEHTDLCAIITQVLQVKPQQDRRRFNNWQQWIQSRKVLMELIQERLEGKMEPYMQQMILWSKSCVVCHQQTDLRVCQRCFSANYCNEHTEAFKRKHDEAKCDRLVLLLNIDIETISGNITDMNYDFLPSINKKGHFEEMLEFCMEYLLMLRKDMDWLAKDYVQSDYLSGPLTVYCNLERICSLGILQTDDIVIHIIAANSIDMNSLPAWEILLHLVPEIQTLSIILIGPELQNSFKRQKLCKLCKKKKNVLLLISISKLYHDFILSTRPAIPNIIVGFHIELSEGDTWSESIKAMQAQNCPLLLSSSCKQKARNDINKIQEILGFIKEPYFNNRNHFGGLAPHKDLETGNTYFRNEHIIFYDNLHCYLSTDSSSSLSE